MICSKYSAVHCSALASGDALVKAAESVRWGEIITQRRKRRRTRRRRRRSSG